jgi:rhodanese-related sulfurtransferase
LRIINAAKAITPSGFSEGVNSRHVKITRNLNYLILAPMLNLFKSVFRNDVYENLDSGEFLAKAKTAPQSVLLDVRTPAEHESGNIPDSINIDIFSPTFEKQVGVLDRNKTCFVYCRSGQRSGQACRLMHGLGFKSLYNLAGGVMALQR